MIIYRSSNILVMQIYNKLLRKLRSGRNATIQGIFKSCSRRKDKNAVMPVLK